MCHDMCSYQLPIERAGIVSRTRIVCAALVVASIFLNGCSTPSWFHGPGFDGPNSELGSGLRPKGKGTVPGTGLDQRAREIEANLGLSH
jgi:hypothetical protein